MTMQQELRGNTDRGQTTTLPALKTILSLDVRTRDPVLVPDIGTDFCEGWWSYFGNLLHIMSTFGVIYPKNTKPGTRSG